MLAWQRSQPIKNDWESVGQYIIFPIKNERRSMKIEQNQDMGDIRGPFVPWWTHFSPYLDKA